MKKNLGTILLSVCLITACNNQDKSKSKDFDYGRVENMKYTNSYFDFEIILPDNWIVQTKEQIDNLTQAGRELVAGDDKRMEAVLKASEVNSAYLLSVNQYELGSSVDFNPSIMIVAENVKNFPGIKTGSDYLFQSKKLLEQSQFRYDYVDEEFSRESVNGTDFYKMNAEMNIMGQNIRQVYYSTIVSGFSFNVIISYIDDQQKQALLSSINSMRFKK